MLLQFDANMQFDANKEETTYDDALTGIISWHIKI